MKDFPSANDLKRIFSNADLPAINIAEGTMNKILNKTAQKKRPSIRLLIAVPLIVILISSTVFAVEHIWSLKGPKDTPYTYSLEAINNKEPKVHEMFSKEINGLKPGEALFIFHNENKPEIIETYYGPQKFYNLKEFEQKVGIQRFLSPDFLPEGYKFKEATVDIPKISDSFIANLIKESQNEKQEYFYKIADLDPQNEVIGYSLLYQKRNQQDGDGEELRMSVNYTWTLDEINERKYDQQAQKIKINDFDAIFTEWDWKGEIKWLMKENNSNTYISVASMKTGENFSPNYIDNLKKVAESIR